MHFSFVDYNLSPVKITVIIRMVVASNCDLLWCAWSQDCSNVDNSMLLSQMGIEASSPNVGSDELLVVESKVFVYPSNLMLLQMSTNVKSIVPNRLDNGRGERSKTEPLCGQSLRGCVFRKEEATMPPLCSPCANPVPGPLFLNWGKILGGYFQLRGGSENYRSVGQ